ncbi:helix-turn-helix transcriptional regulator [Telluria beijingensis]|uniref:helix-turn-helix transcriptional regulator n=1 Tax=Telluria beijingensis TaxID=3068633 RepID=UPI002795AFED|nr:PAS domain-containing protein [Massilia sp. REN29]
MAPRRKLTPEIIAERKTVLNSLQPIVTMLGGIVGPHIEVVLHDLTKPESSVIAIANGHVSGRVVGASILNGPKQDKGFVEAKEALTMRGAPVHSIIEGYTTVTGDSRTLKSGTVIFRDTSGEPFLALCLNADMSNFEMAHAWLGQYLHPVLPATQPEPEKPEMDVLMHEIISDAVRRYGKPVGLMNKREKTLAVQTMQQRGLFIVKGGVERAAGALGVSRYTIYNYLEALRQENAGTA